MVWLYIYINRYGMKKSNICKYFYMETHGNPLLTWGYRFKTNLYWKLVWLVKFGVSPEDEQFMLRGLQQGRFQRRERPSLDGVSPANSSRPDTSEGEEKMIKFFSAELQNAFRTPGEQSLFVKVAIADGIESLLQGSVRDLFVVPLCTVRMKSYKSIKSVKG